MPIVAACDGAADEQTTNYTLWNSDVAESQTGNPKNMIEYNIGI